MKIAEIYQSRQGEGLLTGTPSVFIRTSGCNLRCWFCDTPFTSWQPEGEDLSVDEIIRRATDPQLPTAEMTPRNMPSDLQGGVGFSPRVVDRSAWAEAHATADLRPPTSDILFSR